MRIAVPAMMLLMVAAAFMAFSQSRLRRSASLEASYARLEQAKAALREAELERAFAYGKASQGGCMVALSRRGEAAQHDEWCQIAHLPFKEAKPRYEAHVAALRAKEGQ